MYLFYTPSLQLPHPVLPPLESHHCVHVLRLQAGHTVYLTCGDGNLYQCRIVTPNHQACVLEVVECIENYHARHVDLCMAMAPTKNMERFEWFVEKATEAGVETIVPLICARSERKVCKIDRAQRIAVAALKQCKRAQLPQLQEAVSFGAFVQQTPHAADAHAAAPDSLYAIACCDAPVPRQNFIELLRRKPKKITLLIGPEGDFTSAEIQQAIAQGYTPVHMGSSIFRTETAALAAVMAVYFNELT